MSGTINTIYNNVSYALHVNSKALVQLQEQASTGSLINRASDDPSTAYRILELNSQKTSLEEYTNIIEETSNFLEMSSSVIDSIASTISEAQTRLTQIVSGVYSDESRESTAEGINDLLEQIVSLANTKYNGEYIFGGGYSASEPYSAQRTDGEITRITYQGNDESRNIEIAPGVQSSAFYVGADLFQSDDRCEPTLISNTGVQAGTGTSSVQGSQWLTITGTAGNYSLSLDGGSTTFTTDGTDTNLAVTHSVTGEVLYVDTTQINSTGAALVYVPGTQDIFNSLITIRDALRNEQDLPNAQLDDVLNTAFSSLQEVSELLTQAEVSVGSKIGFLEDIKDSLVNLTYSTEDETSRLEDADIAQIALDLSRREVLYEMSLSIAGSLLSLSLFDYL
ncbi:MAG: flagellar hook-associated protein FlgL [Sedimentisphaerales bacterium]|nr:flagellar hook-associated protein FlgL [Sedimentisphaerales bacterium]